jgi:TRAP-type uncharacterized transport system substrate-binding protein
MYEQAAVMGETFPPMRAFNPADMMSDSGISEFHPGALRFYEEIGLK